MNSSVSGLSWKRSWLCGSIVTHRRFQDYSLYGNTDVCLTWKPQLDSLESAFIGFDNTVIKVKNTQYVSRGKRLRAMAVDIGKFKE